MPTAASTRLGLTSPLAAEGNNVPADLVTLITQLEASTGKFTKGLYAAMPAAGAANDRAHYYATDALAVFFSDATVWVPVGGVIAMTTAVRDALVAGGKWTGRQIYNTTIGEAEIWSGAAWVAIPAGTALLKASNLSDLASASTARTNLGLAAVAASGSASDLTAGTVPTARLGSGAASSATFLRGDQTWGSTLPVGAGAHGAPNTAMTAGVKTTIPFATEDWDTNAFHDTVTNNSRFTVPASYGGTYLILLQTLILPNTAPASTDYVEADIFVNGASIWIGRLPEYNGGNAGYVLQTVFLAYPLIAGDYVQGTAYSVNVAATIQHSSLNLIKVA